MKQLGWLGWQQDGKQSQKRWADGPFARCISDTGTENLSTGVTGNWCDSHTTVWCCWTVDWPVSFCLKVLHVFKIRNRHLNSSSISGTADYVVSPLHASNSSWLLSPLRNPVCRSLVFLGTRRLPGDNTKAVINVGRPGGRVMLPPCEWPTTLLTMTRAWDRLPRRASPAPTVREQARNVPLAG